MDAYQHHGYRESDTCGTLTAEQNQGIRGDTPLISGGGGYSQTVGSLCAVDYKGAGNQYVNDGKLVIQRIE